jgi:hypothetical protein
MENAGRDTGDTLKIPYIRGREGGNYEMPGKAAQSGRHFPIRTVHHRMTVKNGQIPDKTRKTRYCRHCP